MHFRIYSGLKVSKFFNEVKSVSNMRIIMQYIFIFADLPRSLSSFRLLLLLVQSLVNCSFFSLLTLGLLFFFYADDTLAKKIILALLYTQNFGILKRITIFFFFLFFYIFSCFKYVKFIF